MRNAKYQRVAQEYPGTEAGQKAGETAIAEIRSATPQQINISRGFLLENPRISAGLRKWLAARARIRSYTFLGGGPFQRTAWTDGT